MATNLKRFTISITPDMEKDLDAAKRERYYNTTQNEMIRELINKGLATLWTEPKGSLCQHERTV